MTLPGAVFTVEHAGADPRPALERLVGDDALGQLLLRSGAMAELATESGDVKLDWVDQLARARPSDLEQVAALAASLVDAGVERLVWSGMGGSVQAVACLVALGWLSPPGLEIVPLDSTDPRVLARLAADLGRDALRRTGIVAVSMGMTSEEPIAHLRWYDSVADAAGVSDRSGRQLVMTLPGSYLDDYATAHGIRSVPLQLDGENHVAGRMSARAPRVFLLPAALTLGSSDALAEVVRRWREATGLRHDLARDERDDLCRCDPFVALASWLGAQLAEGRDMVLVDTDETTAAFVPWIEQVVEESLCKAGKGLLVFADQSLGQGATPERLVHLRLRARATRATLSTTGSGSGADGATSPPGIPSATLDLEIDTADPVARLAGAARLFTGWSLTVAVVGYLAGLVFAGQPGVESYKRYARELRDAPGPLPFPTADLVPLTTGGGSSATAVGVLWLGALDPGLREDAARAASSLSAPLSLPHAPTGLSAGSTIPASAVGTQIAAVVSALRDAKSLAYLDLTVNGDPVGPGWDGLRDAMRRLAGTIVGVPLKIRSGPRDYHSTEQSQVDGPPDLLSLRVAVRGLPTVPAGEYDDRFFQAQSLGTVLAMRDAGRPVLLAVLDDDDAAGALAAALDDASDLLGRIR
ncbi:MAG: hypothetical protein ACYCR4_04650 [Acidimicrobiales bacterium]